MNYTYYTNPLLPYLITLSLTIINPAVFIPVTLYYSITLYTLLLYRYRVEYRNL
jgi:hypothetical protein